MSGSSSVLRERNVALVVVAGMISSVGNGAMFVAVPFFTFASTGSVTATALVTLAEYVPTVGIAQLAGVLVDRRQPRQILILANGALALCTLGYLAADHWWWLALVAFLRSCVAQLVAPATSTIVWMITPAGRLAAVNGMVAIGSNLARLAGPGLGGVLLGAVGLRSVVVVDAASFVVAALALAAVRPPAAPTRSPRTGVLAAWREGYRAVRHHPVLAPLVAVMAIVGFGEGFVSALIAPWMSTVAGGSATHLGLMLSLQALGGIVGGIVVVRSAHRWDGLSQLSIGALVSASCLLVTFNYPLVASVGPVPAIVLNAMAGFPFALYGTAQAICVQSSSTDGVRGRTTSLTFGVQGASQLAGIALAAPVGHVVGPLAINADTVAYLAAGVLALLLHRRVLADPRPGGAGDDPRRS